MRIAVCLSGLMRTFRECEENIREALVKPFGADVYVFTWDLDADVNLLESSLKPKKIVVESYDSPWRTHTCRIQKEAIPAMYYGIERSHQLLEGQYDIVIRSRMDMLYSHTLSEYELLQCLGDPRIIYVNPGFLNRPKSESHFRFRLRNDCDAPFLFDNFAFGSQAAMDAYSSVYSNLDSLVASIDDWAELDSQSGVIPEVLLGLQVRAREILPRFSGMLIKCTTPGNFWDAKGK